MGCGVFLLYFLVWEGGHTVLGQRDMGIIHLYKEFLYSPVLLLSSLMAKFTTDNILHNSFLSIIIY